MSQLVRSLFASVFLILASSGFSAESEKVDFIFAYDVNEGFPSFMGNGTEIPEENPGTYIEILQLVAQKVPINLILKRYPWSRCKSLIKDNTVDAINSSFKESRTELGVFPRLAGGDVDTERRITSDTYRLYALKHSNVSFDPAAKKIFNIDRGLLAPKGYSIITDMRNWGIPISEHPVDIRAMFKMLVYERASGVIAHDNQARFVLTKNPEFSNILAVEPPIIEKPYYILISKAFYAKHPALAERIWNEIATLRRSHLPEMLKRYDQLLTTR